MLLRTKSVCHVKQMVSKIKHVLVDKSSATWCLLSTSTIMVSSPGADAASSSLILTPISENSLA